MEREAQLEELGGNQNPSSEAVSRSKRGPERRELRRCQKRSNCQRSDEKG